MGEDERRTLGLRWLGELGCTVLCSCRLGVLVQRSSNEGHSGGHLWNVVKSIAPLLHGTAECVTVGKPGLGLLSGVCQSKLDGQPGEKLFAFG